MNHGAIGFVMGHEMTHGFDDEGAQFDGQGNLHNWWTPEDFAAFHAAHRSASRTSPRSSWWRESTSTASWSWARPRPTSAESSSRTAPSRPPRRTLRSPTSAGYTPDQQFFLAAAHVWAANVRPEEARLLAATDPHPPPQFRVNGTFANVPEMADAFRIPANSPMAPPQRCQIW